MNAKISKIFKDSFRKIVSNDTSELDIKKLTNSPYLRLRIGTYRAIYQVINNELTVTVLVNGSRGDVYKWLSK